MNSWGYYMQGSDQLQEVDELGAKLSVALGCAVHYPAFNKNIYECQCGVVFPLYLVKSQNWQLIIRKHQEERSYARR